jgi:putative transposase
VSKYLDRRRTPPSQTWRTFLDHHLQTLVSVDFFVIPTVLCKVLFVFVVLAHERRRVVHINVTDVPTAQWTAQQLVEAFPWKAAPRYSYATATRSTGSRSPAESKPLGSTK